MYLTSLTKVKICNTSTTAIGRASNTSDFYKALYPFDGIFDNSFISFHVRGKKKRERKEKEIKDRLVLPTENTFVNSAIVLRNTTSLKTES